MTEEKNMDSAAIQTNQNAEEECKERELFRSDVWWESANQMCDFIKSLNLQEDDEKKLLETIAHHAGAAEFEQFVRGFKAGCDFTEGKIRISGREDTRTTVNMN